jgi:hypothetical protein
MIINLQHPITVNGAVISSVTLRRIKVADMRAVAQTGGNGIEQTVMLLSRLGELSPAEIDQLDAADMGVLAEAIAGFTAPPGASQPAAISTPSGSS